MYDVITVGSNTIDVFVYTDRSGSICIKTINEEECFISYPTGSKLLINELSFNTGGGGTNAAVSISRLGLHVGYIGKVGSDENGVKIIDMLKKEDVDFLGIVSSSCSEKTGYSIILDSLGHQRTVLAYKGANNKLRFSEINTGKLGTKWFYFSSMVGESFETLKKFSDYANKNKIKIIFNPSNYLAEKGEEYLKDILKKTQILVLNDEEAALLVGRGDARDKIIKLKKLGPEIAIITDGKNPVHCIDNKSNHYKVYPLDVKVVEATGAGDSFASSFLAGIIKTGDIEFSLKLGIVNARSVLKYKGAKSKLLTYKEALGDISKNKIRIEKGKL